MSELQTYTASELVMNTGNMRLISDLAEVMAEGKATVPAHLKGNRADCMAIIMQAMQWGMNPFPVAQKTHIINGVLGYEAQLVNAVITTMAPTKERIDYEWFGPWEKVVGRFAVRKNESGKEYRVPVWTAADENGCGVKVFATMKGESRPRVITLLLAQARVRNSTLWADDPKQQLAYLAVKRWARLHCPDVIMGVYTPDEAEEFGEKIINPMPEYQEPSDKQEDQEPKIEYYNDEEFEAKFPKWERLILSQKLSAQDVVDRALSVKALTKEQLDKVFAVEAVEEEAKPVEGELQ